MPQHAILMNDMAYYVRYESDLNGPGYWVIVDPANPHGFTATVPVRLNALDEWEPVSGSRGLKGGGGNSSKAAKVKVKVKVKVKPVADASAPSLEHRVRLAG